MTKKNTFVVLAIGLCAAAPATGQQAPLPAKALPPAAMQEKGKSAPNAVAATKTVRPDTTKAAAGQELILDEIIIEAILEKPNVAIIPRRRQPDFDEIEFIERSFDNELKRLPKDLLLFDDELDNVQRIETLKKLPAKNARSR